MNKRSLARSSRYFLLVVCSVVFIRGCFLTNIRPGEIGVRYNNALGLLEEDLGPGWHWEVAGLQRVWRLPSRYLFLSYTGSDVLSIRTKDNNTVNVDVSVPYRIIPGKAYAVMDAGNHLTVGGSEMFRFERLANDTAISVLRENLAQLQSQDFYNTDRRLEVAQETLKKLNKALATLQLQASAVLIRAAYFRDAYERQLARIQLNEQTKLLDQAKQRVAKEQQELDNYTQETNALVLARDQDWKRRIAVFDRSYQIGFVESGTDRTPGAARRILRAMAADKRKALAAQASKVFTVTEENITEAHLLGIKNIEAETTEYEQRVRSQADGISGRLSAEGQAKIAKVKGLFESRLNKLLNSPAGRAYVAYRAADNITFEKTLTFQSSDGVPAVLRLRDFAVRFMGR